LKHYSRKCTKKSERDQRELRQKESKPQQENKLPRIREASSNKTQREENGLDNSNSQKLKEEIELPLESKELWQRSEMLNEYMLLHIHYFQ
jgi:hypothetical protein